MAERLSIRVSEDRKRDFSSAMEQEDPEEDDPDEPLPGRVATEELQEESDRVHVRRSRHCGRTAVHAST